MITNADDYVQNESVGEKITPNIILVQGLAPDPNQLVLKKNRKSTKFVDFLKFQNEKRFYHHLSNKDCEYIKAPEMFKLVPGKALFMEYIHGTVIDNFISPQFVS